jgi:hypothetical protein
MVLKVQGLRCFVLKFEEKSQPTAIVKGDKIDLSPVI